MLKCALTKNQERQVAFLPSPQTLTSTGVTWGLIKMQIWVLQVWPGPGILWVFFFSYALYSISEFEITGVYIAREKTSHNSQWFRSTNTNYSLNLKDV